MQRLCDEPLRFGVRAAVAEHHGHAQRDGRQTQFAAHLAVGADIDHDFLFFRLTSAHDALLFGSRTSRRSINSTSVSSHAVSETARSAEMPAPSPASNT